MHFVSGKNAKSLISRHGNTTGSHKKREKKIEAPDPCSWVLFCDQVAAGLSSLSSFHYTATVRATNSDWNISALCSAVCRGRVIETKVCLTSGCYLELGRHGCYLELKKVPGQNINICTRHKTVQHRICGNGILNVEINAYLPDQSLDIWRRIHLFSCLSSWLNESSFFFGGGLEEASSNKVLIKYNNLMLLDVTY